MSKLKEKLSSLYSGLKEWIFTPGRDLLIIIAIIIAVIIVVVVAVGIILGCLGSIIIAAASLPALLLMWAFNWVIPVFGGPTLTFKTSVGLVLLTGIALGLLHAVRK